MGSGLAALAAGEGGRALDLLRPVAEEAEGLGHAVLQLRVAEALAMAELASGEPDQAEDVLRGALRIAEKGSSWARAYRLHHLLAKVLGQRDAGAEATDALQKALDELSRIRENLDQDLLPAFEQLPEVKELLDQTPPATSLSTVAEYESWWAQRQPRSPVEDRFQELKVAARRGRARRSAPTPGAGSTFQTV
ncbi:MAG: hypothetical protein GY856_03545 [bacterium]|nr:hypothetical protein [bacterium]